MFNVASASQSFKLTLKGLQKGQGCTQAVPEIPEDPNSTKGERNVNVKVRRKVRHRCDEQHSRHYRSKENQMKTLLHPHKNSGSCT